MPKKSDKPDLSSDPLIPLFLSIGLTLPKALEAVKYPKGASFLRGIIEKEALADVKLEEKQAMLVAAFAVQAAKSEALAEEKSSLIVKEILDKKLQSVDQVSVATKYLESHPLPIDRADFDKSCGIGFMITPTELSARINSYISTKGIVGWAHLGSAINGLKASPELRWVNSLDLKNSVESAFTEKFGPKNTKSKEPKAAVAKASDTISGTSFSRKSVFEEGFLGSLHRPGENPQLHSHLREAHLAATNGAVWTRFPPEPNGYLHIGHSKAIFVNFGYAAHNGGKCYLRYDDTNPDKEEGRYFESILEMVRWLGYRPWKITYSSDYFDQLYELAIKLIKRHKAYVCHCTRDEITKNRGENGGPRKACIHRSRPVEESLVEFENMKNGKYREQEANLRMKQDLEDGNPQMWDLTAYRVKEVPHHRTKDRWKIYPTYDFTHCLVDSFENISHSLCTTEFVASRQSYEWLCDAVEVYKPKQSEYGRLSLNEAVTSKRKILSLVNEGYVRDWDDPRLYTLVALRRRGIPPEAIISFVSNLGVSTAPSTIQISRFEQTVRQYLEGTAPRLLMVLRPLKVTIEDLPEDYALMIEKPLHPKVPSLGTTTIPFTRTLYIDADDFRLEDSTDYFRLAPGKTVGLFQAPHPITCTSYETDPISGEVVELICRLEDGKNGHVKKPKAFIQWVAAHLPSGSPVLVNETRIFHALFKSSDPLAVMDKSNVNPNSAEVIKGAFLEVGFWPLAKRAFAEARRENEARTERVLRNASEPSPGHIPCAKSDQLFGKECVRFQGLRVAYFALDKDSITTSLDDAVNFGTTRKQGDYLVLNRIVSLKEDSGKTA